MTIEQRGYANEPTGSHVTGACLVNGPNVWLRALPRLDSDACKYDRGHVLIVGGYPMTGAARLVARAAARVGAGLTTIAVPEVAFAIYATALESIMVHPLASDGALAEMIAASSFSAFVIGPGAGVGEATRSKVVTLLATKKPIVLDADALTSFSDSRVRLFPALHENCVLTPHEGEFSRLFGGRGNKANRASRAAAESGAIVVLKGRETVIAAPDGRSIVNRTAPPTLATAGAGDVLAGIIGGLLAQRMDAFFAAAAGVWIHGAAAAAFGPGLIADDLPDLLPTVLRQHEALKTEHQ